jgi:ferrous iron transport protein B
MIARPHDKWRLALIGNPNTGKSSIFNALTGAQQHVGNWPGKTVEKKSGTFTHAGREFELIDLPGAYSLSAFSAEESIAREALLELCPHLVIVVLDASNLERNLYLAVQVLEMGLPVVVALNMIDAAKARGLHIDTARLAQALGSPVVSTIARRGQGIDALLAGVAQALRLETRRGSTCTAMSPGIA